MLKFSFSLKRRQLDKLSDITADLGLVSTASVVIPSFFDKYNLIMLLSGLTITVIFWVISLWLAR